MDFSKLNSNEKLAVYGSVAAIIGGLVGGLSGLIWLSILAAFGVLAVLFVPMMSAGTTMPGSKGSLLVVLGGVAAAAAVLGLLTIIADIGFWFESFAVRTIFFLIAVAGSLIMGWAGWQAFQAEGGKFQVGMPASGASSAGPAAPSAPAAPAAPPAQATPAAPQSAPAEPMAPRDEPMAPPPATGSTAPDTDEENRA
jgi:hypothetical protein